MPTRARSAATSHRQCRTTSCTAPTRPSRLRARSPSGFQTALSELPDYALVNRETWTKANAEYTDANAERAWSRDITWGMWSVPEEDVHALPDVAGKDVIELGCGTAYFSAYLARLGARVVGVDVTPAQLATARRMQKRFGLDFPLIEANAEDVPLPDASFDLV